MKIDKVRSQSWGGINLILSHLGVLGGTDTPVWSVGSLVAENNLPFELSLLDGDRLGDLVGAGENKLMFDFWVEILSVGSVVENKF